MNRNLKVCVAGVGAVGGVLAAMLGSVCPENLTLIARGARGEALRENGLTLHSEFYGERTLKPVRVCADAAGLPVQDYLFLCVKNYSLTEIAETIRPLVGERTVLLPVMNGVEAGDRLRALFPRALVCDSVIYTNSSAGPAGSVTQIGTYTYLYVGSKVRDAAHQDAARAAFALVRETGFDVRFSEDIEGEIWQKFILNCAFNIVTARYLCSTGDLRRDEDKRRDVYALLREAAQVGFAEGVALPPDIVEQKAVFIMERQAPQSTSSMRRDVEARRPTELDAFTGAVLRKAAQYGIPVPVTERYHRALEEITGGYSK